MRLILFFFSLLFFVHSALAQQKSYTVNLTPLPMQGSRGFAIKNIVDKRIVKTNIGFAQKGLANRKVPAVFPHEFNLYLQYIMKRIPATCDPCDSLTVLVHEFNVAEYTTALSESGIFRIQLEFAKNVSDSLYSVGFVETQIEGKDMDVTQWHANRVLDGIVYCIEEFDLLDWQNDKGQLIDSDTTFEFNPQIVPKKGLYSSFSQLCKNTPFMEDGYTLNSIYDNMITKYTLIGEDGKKIRNRIIGFSDGENIFINSSGYSYDTYFVKSKFIGHYIYFEDRFFDPFAVIMFGMVGSALSNKIRPLVLDTKTGLTIVLTDNSISELLRPYPYLRATFKTSKRKIEDYEKAIIEVNEKLNNTE